MKKVLKFIFELLFTPKYQKLINWLIGVPCLIFDVYLMYTMYRLRKELPFYDRNRRL